MTPHVRRKTVLLVDDDVSVTRYLANKVHSETTLTSIIAGTLADAASLVEDGNVDVDGILTDVYFNEATRDEKRQLLDGLDLLAFANKARPGVKMYVFSIWMEQEELPRKAERLGISVSAWFHKMFYPPGISEDTPWKVIQKDLIGNDPEPEEKRIPNGNAVVFDVFLAHNSKNKDEVRVIANDLKRWGLKPWLDEWNVPPGRPFQDAIEEALPVTRSIAVFVGADGLGPWQSLEQKIAITQFVERNALVIPVILESGTGMPSLPPFLREFNAVTFSSEIPREESIRRLVWGITQRKPTTAQP